MTAPRGALLALFCLGLSSLAAGGWQIPPGRWQQPDDRMRFDIVTGNKVVIALGEERLELELEVERSVRQEYWARIKKATPATEPSVLAAGFREGTLLVLAFESDKMRMLIFTAPGFSREIPFLKYSGQ